MCVRRVIAVSYTHLDVYKRQWRLSSKTTSTKLTIVGTDNGTITMRRSAPVSYTHLDVYKRQASNRGRRRWKTLDDCNVEGVILRDEGSSLKDISMETT